jgi:hypothetical protein
MKYPIYAPHWDTGVKNLYILYGISISKIAVKNDLGNYIVSKK